MKLYNMNLSNFATKSRLVIYEKGINIEMAPIPGGDLKSAEYAKVNMLGKTPALDADGLIVPESEVINEYLEDKFPNPPLLPKSPEGRAKVRIITRFHDLYLEPPLRALFGQMNPKTRDEKVVGEKVTDFKNRLDQLEKIVADGGYACGSEFTLRIAHSRRRCSSRPTCSRLSARSRSTGVLVSRRGGRMCRRAPR